MHRDEVSGQIDHLFAQWQNLQPMNPDDSERLNKKITLHWNYHSNHIEGNTLTYNETKLLLFFDRCDGGHVERHYTEMKAHDVAIKLVTKHAKDKGHCLNEVDIRNFNKIILKEEYYRAAQTPDGENTDKLIIPGKYKTSPNHVRTRTGEIFKFAEALEVPIKMQELLRWFHKEMHKPKLPIIDFIAKIHYDFIIIHPFDDGNGRVARLLVNYALMKKDYPPLVIDESEKDNYFLALNSADVGEFNALAIFLGRALIKWLKISIRAAEGKKIEDIGDIDKKIDNFISDQIVTEKHHVPTQEKVNQTFHDFFFPLIESVSNGLDKFKKLFSDVTFHEGNRSLIKALVSFRAAMIYDNYIGKWQADGEAAPKIFVKLEFTVIEKYSSITITISKLKTKRNERRTIERKYPHNHYHLESEITSITNECKEKFLEVLSSKNK